jgi:hypothetical protein
MRRNRPTLFKGRHFEAEIIVLCVRWYLRFGLSFRNLEEMMAERNLNVDHVTIWRWVQRYAPELNRRCRPELRRTNGSWRVDETYLRVAGKWTYLYRAVDSSGATIDFLLSSRRNAAAARTIQGLEVANMIRKGQMRWLAKGDIVGRSRSSQDCLSSALLPDSVRPADQYAHLFAFATLPPHRVWIH